MAKIGIELRGMGETMSELRGAASRCRNPEGAFEEIFRALEESERRIFDEYGGKYVRTGATRESLTQPDANGAIRRAHDGEFVFGTSVWYAKFQGTTGKGHHHDPSALVKLTPEVAEMVRLRLFHFIHPQGAGGRFISTGP